MAAGGTPAADVPGCGAAWAGRGILDLYI